METWRNHYNGDRPHSALGNLSPRELAVLPGHSSRLPFLLGKVAAVQHPHPFRMLQPGPKVLLQPSYNRLIVPGRSWLRRLPGVPSRTPVVTH